MWSDARSLADSFSCSQSTRTIKLQWKGFHQLPFAKCIYHWNFSTENAFEKQTSRFLLLGTTFSFFGHIHLAFRLPFHPDLKRRWMGLEAVNFKYVWAKLMWRDWNYNWNVRLRSIRLPSFIRRFAFKHQHFDAHLDERHSLGWRQSTKTLPLLTKSDISNKAREIIK